MEEGIPAALLSDINILGIRRMHTAILPTIMDSRVKGTFKNSLDFEFQLIKGNPATQENFFVDTPDQVLSLTTLGGHPECCSDCSLAAVPQPTPFFAYFELKLHSDRIKPVNTR